MKSLRGCQAFLPEQVIGPEAPKLAVLSVNRGKAMLRIRWFADRACGEIAGAPQRGQEFHQRQILPVCASV